MKAISLFDAKTHLSDIVREVSTEKDGVIITVRGLPKVRVIPYEAKAEGSAWEVRERHVAQYGEWEDIDLPERSNPIPINPFESET
jgi:prevent-host-death family protein